MAVCIAEVVKGVGDVLAGRVEELFAVVKGVGDVLAGRGAGCLWRCLWRWGG